MKTGTLNYFQFDDNEITFFQDMWFWKSVPTDVKFYCVACTDHSVELVGDGYGIQDKHGLPGSYGNGSIYINLKELPADVLDYCKNNVLKYETRNLAHARPIQAKG